MAACKSEVHGILRLDRDIGQNKAAMPPYFQSRPIHSHTANTAGRRSTTGNQNEG